MKITQRDKMLLLLLVALLVIALVIVLPGVGVMACNEKMNNIKSEEVELDTELSERLNELYELGVDSVVAENAQASMNRLDDKILTLEMEAARLAGSIMAYAKPYAVDENWVDGLEYRYGIKSDENEKIVEYSPIADVESSDNGNNKHLVLKDKEYDLPTATREIRFTVTDTAECTYSTEYSLDEYDLEQLGATLLFLQNITSKGSMLIDELYYYTTGDMPQVVNFTLLMPPEGSGISEYATIVAEKLRAMEEEEAE